VSAYEAAEWTDLFVASAGASAALTGLIFVAVSINVERIIEFKGLPERAAAQVLILLGVLIVSLIALIPGQSTTALGLELLVEGLLVSVAAAWLTARSLADSGGSSPGGRISLAAIGTLPFVIAGTSLLLETGGGLYWVVGGMVGAIVGAVLNAWVLLVEILR